MKLNCNAGLSSVLTLASTTILAMLIAMIAITDALAGGDDFDGPDDTAASGPSYYGFVRDTRGVGVGHADVVLTPRGGIAVTVKTNVLGLYRSHVSRTVSPADVLVSCSALGYVQVKVVRRQGTPSARQIETSCILQVK
jgi:hypothetical protein